MDENPNLFWKDTNPKAPFGDARVPLSTVPATVLAEVAVGMLEGSLKYGRHNYRVDGCRASTYYDAAMRHLMAWWEGEDIDPDSGTHHLTKAICSLLVLRDAMILGKVNDDRPPPAPAGFLRALNAHVVDLRKMFPNPKEPYTAQQLAVDAIIDDALFGNSLLDAEAAAAPEPSDPLDMDGFTVVGLGDPAALHNAIAEAVGEPSQGVKLTVQSGSAVGKGSGDWIEVQGPFDRRTYIGDRVSRRIPGHRDGRWIWRGDEGQYVRVS
jgi:hypothetical protein